MWRLAALVVLVALAGCSGVPGTVDRVLDQDPDDDRLGWENGYWYDDPVSVTTEDGLNASEREAVLARTMARVEVIRDREFEEAVSLEVITRAEYRNRSGGRDGSVDRWNEQVWEALLLVGEDRTVGEAMGSTRDVSVQGFYRPGTNSIVLVSDAPTPMVDRATLAHELVHALQDQHADLGPAPDTQDRQLARRSVTEGEANYVQALYEERCASGWACLDRPDRSTASGGSALDGVFLVVFQPYATGPGFVQRTRDAQGWSGVDRLYEEPPVSTEQVIHPGAYPDETPVDVRVPDRSGPAWSRFDHDPVADTVGEASIFAMLAVHGATGETSGSRFRYVSEPSAGWAGDALVPYHDGDRGAYVWRTRWDSAEDAREFARAYRSILAARAEASPRPGVYVLPESDPFGDAFFLTRDGDRVTIVNAPTRQDLGAVHAPAGA